MANDPTSDGIFADYEDRFRQEDIYIGIAAASHEDRHRFISAHCTDENNLGLKEDDNATGPCTDARIWTCQHDKHRVHLLELPNFDPDASNADNIKALRSTASILSGGYIASDKASLLKGILYFGEPGSASSLLKEVIGDENLTYVSLKDAADPKRLCKPFLGQSSPGPLLPIQREFFAEARTLHQTTAGMTIWKAIEARLMGMGYDADPELYDELKRGLASMEDNLDGVVQASIKKEVTDEGGVAASFSGMLRVQVKVDPNEPTNKNGSWWATFMYWMPKFVPRTGAIMPIGWLGLGSSVIAGAAVCAVM